MAKDGKPCRKHSGAFVIFFSESRKLYLFLFFEGTRGCGLGCLSEGSTRGSLFQAPTRCRGLGTGTYIAIFEPRCQCGWSLMPLVGLFEVKGPEALSRLCVFLESYLV